jgi:hypothetical protein
MSVVFVKLIPVACNVYLSYAMETVASKPETLDADSEIAMEEELHIATTPPSVIRCKESIVSAEYIQIIRLLNRGSIGVGSNKRVCAPK